MDGGGSKPTLITGFMIEKLPRWMDERRIATRYHKEGWDIVKCAGIDRRISVKGKIQYIRTGLDTKRWPRRCQPGWYGRAVEGGISRRVAPVEHRREEEEQKHIARGEGTWRQGI